jgi:hypothetical protein
MNTVSVGFSGSAKKNKRETNCCQLRSLLLLTYSYYWLEVGVGTSQFSANQTRALYITVLFECRADGGESG